MIILAAALVLSGCPKPPTDALDAARSAMMDAEFVQRCAESEYRAAERLLQQAEEAVEAEEYDRAEQLARAAEEQMEVARAAAEANREDCERTEAVREDLTSRDDEREDAGRRTTEAPPTDYELTPVYFGFDEASLSAEARQKLERHAEWLEANPGISVVIQGHCDDLGSTEYNLALGDRRARVVADYLHRLGVERDRMRTISYGEEMPVGTDAQNRRVAFVANR